MFVSNLKCFHLFYACTSKVKMKFLLTLINTLTQIVLTSAMSPSSISIFASKKQYLKSLNACGR